MRAPEHMALSVVVPCFNEEAVLTETHRRLREALVAFDDVEIIYVNDGSTDRTAEILGDLSRLDRTVRVLSFARNFGHSVAVTAGLDHASGDAVVLIDADLQDPPELIPEMVRLWNAGNHVVYGVRVRRDGETRFKRATAAAFYRLMNRLSDVPIPLDTGDFRLMDRRVVDVLRRMPERARFVRGMVAWAGFRQCPIHYERQARFAGETGYSLAKMLRFAIDGLTSFSSAPLRVATWIGTSASAIGLLGVVYAVVARVFTRSWVPGWAALFVAVMFMGGVQLLCLGVIGEYVGRIYAETKQRPLYVLETMLGFPGDLDRSFRSRQSPSYHRPEPRTVEPMRV
jgi:polyisoprenyl-phosphate glycosyltransferase